jgi:hypothetical protein
METHITFVLDSSGSMSSIREDTIGGFNTFLEDQTEQEGETTVTLFEFNTSVDCIYQDIPIDEASKLDTETYIPGGRTALHDALTTAVESTRSHVVSQAETPPENVIIVILTDGKENASETPQNVVRDEVEYQREDAGWEFLFIGANQDAALTAETMGMDAKKSLDMAHSGEGARNAYSSTSEVVDQIRETGGTDGYDEEHRRQQDSSS